MIAMLIGMASGFAGVDMESPTNRALIWCVGLVLTLAATLIPMQMILGRDFGEFRLVLLGKNEVNPPPMPSAEVAATEAMQKP